MFEDFSFSSPSSTRPPRLALDGDEHHRFTSLDHDSGLISPLSSRCPSPRSSAQRFPRSLPRSRSSYSRGQAQAPTSVPFSAYDQKRFSISTLTKKLHEHTLQNQSGSIAAVPSDDRFPDAPISPTSPSDLNFPNNNSAKIFPGYVLTPPDTDLDDESLTSGSLSPTFPPPSSSPYLNPTSAPATTTITDTTTTPMDLMADDNDYDYQEERSFTSTTVRAQRQHISRLQYCNPTDLEAIRLALISEDEALRTTVSHNYSSTCEDDWHPSSLPPQSSPRRRALTTSRGSRFRPATDSSSSSSSPYSSNSSSTSSWADTARSRRKSSVSALQLSHRIEKSYQLCSTRDLRKKSEQGLRRKSLVSAALASMVE
ncbi:uncharacterized protein BO97DRAFT_253341 [Aspergillus homomorphus CBS 101889]|uniref:Uncharacterized protein n=1 Tax=Aspergillus homomorphus (strain CBS 101889) TaxID=1450537 RepID=A0A395HMB6_ASPHC|nr:hypothetical protein BO97DRAFT_253341 [Aspergillus homomorphus CBS 101889]RAL07414.1 hypothetical protein BO97DRAFT_253341 [Aspergillus homomorphus CBS 101889]